MTSGAAAEFDGIGLRAENYRAALDEGLDDAAMAALAAATPVMEVEYVTGWGTAGDRTPEQRAKEATVFHMARAFGVGHVNAGLLEPVPVDDLVVAFGELCDRAGADLAVALEFMPYSGVRDLATAWRIVRDAGRPNGALLVDGWHWARSGAVAADLDGVDPGRIVSVQLCDVAAEPMARPRAESLGHRLPPGRGHGDTVGLVRALESRGVAPRVVGVEVISDELVAGGVVSAAHVSADAARDVLDRATRP